MILKLDKNELKIGFDIDPGFEVLDDNGKLYITSGGEIRRHCAGSERGSDIRSIHDLNGKDDNHIMFWLDPGPYEEKDIRGIYDKTV